jgi:protein-tyrosine kinase
MSIIEEAVRKNAERQNRQSSTDPLRAQARLRRVPAAPVDTAHAQRFQPVVLDKAALHDNFILPQLQDAGALRAYKILRTRVLRRLEANQWHSFALTGVTAGEGKTLTAVNLAIALAQDVNTWVALIDLDLQRPRVAEYLGMRSVHGEKGLSDYLQGNATFENIVYSPDIERLMVVPNFQPMVNSSETLTSPRMAELLQALEAETPRRILIFDMPPACSHSRRRSTACCWSSRKARPIAIHCAAPRKCWRR